MGALHTFTRYASLPWSRRPLRDSALTHLANAATCRLTGGVNTARSMRSCCLQLHWTGWTSPAPQHPQTPGCGSCTSLRLAAPLKIRCWCRQLAEGRATCSSSSSSSTQLLQVQGMQQHLWKWMSCFPFMQRACKGQFYHQQQQQQ